MSNKTEYLKLNVLCKICKNELYFENLVKGHSKGDKWGPLYNLHCPVCKKDEILRPDNYTEVNSVDIPTMWFVIQNFRIRTVSVEGTIRYQIQKKGRFFWRNWNDGLFTNFDTAKNASAAILKHAANEVVLAVNYQPQTTVRLSPAELRASLEESSRPFGGIFGD